MAEARERCRAPQPTFDSKKPVFVDKSGVVRA
jgi:hypothetical protein